MRVVWLVVLSIFTVHAQAAVMETITQTTTGKCSPTVGHAGGPVTIVCQEGLPAEQFQRFAEELGVTKAALTSFFKILEQQRVPPEDLDSTLREIAASYKRLHAQLQQFLSEDPAVMALRRAASQALEAGDFPQVETLLHQARERDLHAIQAQQASLKQRQRSAAVTSAELGALKTLQLAYAAAATHYRHAAAVVPPEETLTQAAYLNAEGVAWMAAGQYAAAQPSLEHALALREQGLGPEHPDVAQSLNNLAALYRAQGRYADAEPRYQRALAIFEQALGPAHPDVAQSLNNLALLYQAQGRYADAEPHYQRALAIFEQALGPAHPHVATVGKNYAALLRATHREADAARLEAQWPAHQPAQAWLGIQMQRSTAPPGLVVERVMAESPAAKAGIQPQDVILRFNAQDVPDPQTLLRLVGATAIGTTVDVEILQDGQRRTIPVTLEQRPLSSP